jgi:hypothetical protein
MGTHPNNTHSHTPHENKRTPYYVQHMHFTGCMQILFLNLVVSIFLLQTPIEALLLPPSLPKIKIETHWFLCGCLLLVYMYDNSTSTNKYEIKSEVKSKRF